MVETDVTEHVDLRLVRYVQAASSILTKPLTYAVKSSLTHDKGGITPVCLSSQSSNTELIYLKES